MQQDLDSIYREPFLVIPRRIFLDSRLTIEEMVLYSFLIDRSKLSRQNQFQDSWGIFVFCTIKEAATVLRCSIRTAIRVFHSLEKKKKIRRIHQGLNMANKYYVNLEPYDDSPTASEFGEQPLNELSAEESTDCRTVTSDDSTTHRTGQKQVSEVQICHPQCQNVTPDGSKTTLRMGQNQTSEVQICHTSKNEYNNNKKSNNEDSKQECSHAKEILPADRLEEKSSLMDITRAKCHINYFQRLKNGEDSRQLDAELQQELQAMAVR